MAHLNEAMVQDAAFRLAWRSRRSFMTVPRSPALLARACRPWSPYQRDEATATPLTGASFKLAQLAATRPRRLSSSAACTSCGVGRHPSPTTRGDLPDLPAAARCRQAETTGRRMLGPRTSCAATASPRTDMPKPPLKAFVGPTGEPSARPPTRGGLYGHPAEAACVFVPDEHLGRNTGYRWHPLEAMAL